MYAQDDISLFVAFYSYLLNKYAFCIYWHLALNKLKLTENKCINIFCCNAALRTTRESPYVCMFVCVHKLFCHLLKKSSGNPYLKICDLMQYFFADTPMKKK